jgi:hypothetical protein
MIAITLLSHVVTENEVFILNFTLYVSIGYSVILGWIGLQEVHNYGFWRAVQAMLLTLFFMITVLVVAFNLMILYTEVYVFIDSIIREVLFNVFGFK